jgi:hypothetical protein
MACKRQEYCAAGVQVVWEVDTNMRMVEVFTALTNPQSSTKHKRWQVVGIGLHFAAPGTLWRA